MRYDGWIYLLFFSDSGFYDSVNARLYGTSEVVINQTSRLVSHSHGGTVHGGT